jgi:sugar phosphate isomerase/epimerase
MALHSPFFLYILIRREYNIMSKTLPVALQLYTVRDYAGKDFGSTLKKVKEMGYDYVETAGLYGLAPSVISEELSNAGLAAISAHVPIDELIADTKGTVNRYKTIGCKYIAIPYLGSGMRPGDEKFDDILKNIGEIGRVCSAEGITLLYHNHDFEFIVMPDGSFGLDYIYSKIPADLLQTELDTCWVKVAGQDPASYIKKYKGRAPVVHLKDFRGSKSENMYELIGTNEKKAETGGKFEFRPVGYGLQDFPSILAASLEAGAEYVVVEQDSSSDCTSLEAAAKSRAYLKTLGW